LTSGTNRHIINFTNAKKDALQPAGEPDQVDQTLRYNNNKSRHAYGDGHPGAVHGTTDKEYARKEPGPEAAFDDGLP
jgi:hypothetical protein